MEHVELVDRVYQKIKQMIFDRELKPGQKLVQEKLSAQLGISRSPLLKALQMLENELLVERIPRRGMYVKTLSHEEIIDIFQCRSVIEGLSARLAAQKLSGTQLKELRNCFKPFKDKGAISEEAYSQADRAFHQKIMEWSGNAVILRLEVLSNIHLNAYQVGLIRPPEETLSEHFGIIEALEKGDGVLAERLMREHIEKSTDVLIGKLESLSLLKTAN